ncbi:hypothetical protein [Rubellimicrobium mesophilum]|nr:hypothetical protein [Rubellimicrobium mesophilum]
MIARISTLLALGAFALSACTQPAPAPQPVGPAPSVAPADRLAAAIESEGCVLNSQNSGAVLLRANLTRDELAPLILQLQSQGQVEASGDASIRLLSQNCI